MRKNASWTPRFLMTLGLALMLGASGDALAAAGRGKAGGGKGKGKSGEKARDKEKAKENDDGGEAGDTAGKDEGPGKAKRHRNRERKQEHKGWKPKDAQEAKDWGEGGTPPGWTRGKKTGWGEGEMPPGLLKKGDLPPAAADWPAEKRAKWEEELEATIAEVEELVKARKEASAEQQQAARLSVEQAARKGVPLQTAAEVVRKAVEEGITPEGIEKTSRALAYALGKKIDFVKLGKDINAKIASEEHEDDLVVEIYKEIEAQEAK